MSSHLFLTCRFFPVAEKVVKSLPSKVTLEALETACSPFEPLGRLLGERGSVFNVLWTLQVVVATEDENEAKAHLF